MRSGCVRRWIAGCLLMGSQFVHSQDWTHLEAHLHFDTLQLSVSGTVHLSFQATEPLSDTLALHGKDLTIHTAHLDHRPVECIEGPGGNLYIPLHASLSPGNHRITIQYAARPQRGMHFAGWTDTTHTHPRQIYTHGQGNLHRHWIPLYDFPDDKYTWELHLHFNPRYAVYANGTRIPTDEPGHWHYRMDTPIPPYTAVIAIGKYREHRLLDRDSLECIGLVYPGGEATMEPTYQHASAILTQLEDQIGVPYPFDVYRQIPVSDYTYGGMENATTILLNDRYLVDSLQSLDRDYLRVHIHEWAHQWFGTWITARNDTHHWIQEGFATYFDHVIRGALLGEEVERGLWSDARDRIFSALQKDSLPLANPKGSYERHYLQGAMTVRMLRAYVGDTAFRAGIRDFVKDHAGSWADSRDVFRAIQPYTSRDLDRFCAQFVERWALPLVVFGVMETESGWKFMGQCTDWQGFTFDDFSMDIPIAIYQNDSIAEVRKLQLRDGRGELMLDRLPQWYEVDPDVTQLMFVLSHPTEDQIIQQFLHSPNAHSAFQAWREIIQNQPLIEIHPDWLHRLMHHPSPEFRRRVADGMEMHPQNWSDTLMRAYLQDSDFAVVRAAAAQVHFTPADSSQLWDWFENHATPESLRKIAIESLFHGADGQEERVLDRWSRMDSGRSTTLRLDYLFLSFAYPNNRRPRMDILEEWIHYTDPRWSADLRETAFSGLMQSEPWDLLDHADTEYRQLIEQLRWNARDALGNPYRSLRSMARRFLDVLP